MTFRVGMKVACVDADFDDVVSLNITGLRLPVLNKIYTIRDIVDGFDGFQIKPGLVLEELYNNIGPYGTEYNFNPIRFRPIVETSIAIFTEMLTKVDA